MDELHAVALNPAASRDLIAMYVPCSLIRAGNTGELPEERKAMPYQQTCLKWIKASRSYATSQCVELAAVGDMIALRDSKNPAVHMHYTHSEMDAFLDGAKRGEFDHLINRGLVEGLDSSA